MSSVLNKEEQISMFINDAKNHGIKVVPPSVNQSKAYFYSNKKGDIIYGLAAIKNVGTKSAEILSQYREDNGEYKTIFDLCEIDSKAINKKVLEGLKNHRLGRGDLSSLICECKSRWEVIKTQSPFRRNGSEPHGYRSGFSNGRRF